ncbi:MAG: DASS family sodium-coupled anion symporter [Cellvibrionaceae bacterium]|nr:DASS family sodium-coupled anion symporter [Cellvibrionaceae bacterium]
MEFVKSKSFAACGIVFIVVTWVHYWGIPGAQLGEAQSVTAGILLIASILWITEWVPLFVVSFLILALQIIWLYPLLTHSDFIQSEAIFFAPFFSDIILLFLGGFVLSILMQKYGLDLRFAHWILLKTNGAPALTLLGIILACSFLSMWISNTATTAMMLTVVLPLLKDIPQAHPFRKALVLAIPFGCNLGGIGTPIGTPPNAIALSYLNKTDIAMTFGKWMLLTLPFLLIFLLLLWQTLLKLFPAGTLQLKVPKPTTEAFTNKHWAALVIFIATALGWFLSGYIGFSPGTVALLPIIFSFWFGLLKTSDFRSLPWDVLYIVAGGLALGVALKASGLGELIVNAIPLNHSPIVLLVVFSAVALVLSTVMSNTATAGLVIPLVINLKMADDQLLSLVIALALVCSMAMALPVSTPPNAIAFSSRAISSRDMLLTGSLLSLIGLVLLSMLGPVYWQFILSRV